MKGVAFILFLEIFSYCGNFVYGSNRNSRVISSPVDGEISVAIKAILAVFTYLLFVFSPSFVPFGQTFA